MTAHRCQSPGCGRFVRAGARFCPPHLPPGGLDAFVETTLAAVTDALDDACDDAASQFRARLDAGSYAGLYPDEHARIMDEATKALAEQGLVAEIGSLRIVLARLMAEEKDVARLAASVARVAAVAVQVARAQRAISGEAARGITAALARLLAELDAE